jgi:hypothetical protein
MPITDRPLTGPGSRSDYTRTDRINEDIAAKYENRENFERRAKVLSRSRRREIGLNPWMTSSSRQKLETHFGREEGYYLADSSPCDPAVTECQWLLRAELIRDMVCGKLLPLAARPDGSTYEPDLASCLAEIAKRPRLSALAIDFSVIERTCILLEEAGIARKNEEGTYSQRALTLEEVDANNVGRVAYEMTYHRERIEQFRGRPDLRVTFCNELEKLYDGCLSSLTHGQGFRRADERFHRHIPRLPDNRQSLSELIYRCDQPYMKMELLAGIAYDPATDQYAELIGGFNRKQCADLGRIVAEYRERKPSMKRIETFLHDHVGLQRQAWEIARRLWDELR